MSLTFEKKGRIFNHLGNPERWDSVFDNEFYDDPTRKYRSRAFGGITLSHPPDVTDFSHLIIKHAHSGARLEIIEENDIGFRITDERGVTVLSTEPFIEPRKDGLPHAANINSTSAKAKIEHMGITVSFSKDGEKNITFDRSNAFISLNGPDEGSARTLRNGKLLHRIIISDDELLDLTGVSRNRLTLFQMVVARDMALQPSLKGFNGLATNDEAGMTQLRKLNEEVRSSSGSRRFRDWFFGAKNGRYALMERAWFDTTEFVGYSSEIPSRFAIRKQDETHHLFTSLEGREKIWSYSKLFKSATQGHPRAVRLTAIQPENFAKSLLDKGEEIEDQRGDKWKFIIVKHRGDFAALKDTQDQISERLQIDSNDFAVINFKPKLSIVAIRADILEEIKHKKPLELTPTRQRRGSVIDPALVVRHMPDMGGMG